ncbi:MAG: CPBP family intramembrane metalloprotease [Anaerolineales bacterium]|nr:CPBP family intramembrane metalloprotease [Anaerolineales bacterium]
MTELQSTPKRGLISNIFISSDEPRLRAGWRLLLQTLLMLIIGIPISLLAGSIPISGDGLFLSQIVELIIFTLSIYIARRWLDKRSFLSLGLRVNKQAFVDIFIGIAITFVMMGFIYLAEVAMGWLTFERFAWQVEPINSVIIGVLSFLIVFIFVGFNEELLSRGYHLQTLASGINMFWGVLISSSLFGIAHLGNPNATWVSAVGIFFAGVFLAYGYIRTGQLWLSIGLHIGWNFFEGVIFGFPVSGLDIYRLVRHQVNGPEIWTGGAFGPEAGLIVLPALVIGSALIYLYTMKRTITK